jgi:hypothetical protein
VPEGIDVYADFVGIGVTQENALAIVVALEVIHKLGTHTVVEERLGDRDVRSLPLLPLVLVLSIEQDVEEVEDRGISE